MIIRVVGPEFRNVIVFALGGVRHAAELRWVREVVTIGFITEIPTAPPGLSGAFNLRGSLIPVLDIGLLSDKSAGPPPRQGDGALLVEFDGVTAALRVDKVDEVATLPPTPDGTAVIDGRGAIIPLVDPPAVLRRAIAVSQAARGDDAEVVEGFSHARDSITGARTVRGFDQDVNLG
jgi:chemotaxis signal transduction protein